MDIPNYYRFLDEFEYKRREELDRDLSIPLGLLTVLFGFNFALLGEIATPFSSVEVIVGVGVALSISLLLVGAVILWVAHVGVKYKGPTTSDAFEKYLAELNEWATPQEHGAPLMEVELEIYEIKSKIETSAQNAAVNQKRAARILLQKQVLGAALLFTCAAAGTHGTAKIFSAEYRTQLLELNQELGN